MSIVSGSSASGPQREIGTTTPREKKGILAGAIAGATGAIPVNFLRNAVSLITEAKKNLAVSGSKGKAQLKGIDSRKAHATGSAKKAKKSKSSQRSGRSKRSGASQDIEDSEETPENHEVEEKKLTAITETGESNKEDEQEKKREELYSRLRQLAEDGGTSDLQNIIDVAWDVFGDVTYVYDGLRAAREHFANSDEELSKNLSNSTLAAGDILFKENEPNIRAGWMFGPGKKETNDYRECVIGHKTVSGTLGAVYAKAEGNLDSFNKIIDTLFKYLQIDLKAQESTMDPNHLRHINDDLFKVRVSSQTVKEFDLLLRDMQEFYGTNG